MFERFFDRKVKEFHELRMGSMTMDAFINIFFDLFTLRALYKGQKSEDTTVFRMSSSQFSRDN